MFGLTSMTRRRLSKGKPRFKIDGDVSLALMANYTPAVDKLDLIEMGLKPPTCNSTELDPSCTWPTGPSWT